MSKIDKNKEDKEELCFQHAIQLGQRNKNQTTEILNYLNGEKIIRPKEDRPDLVYLCTKGKKHPQKMIVGIEHFLVNQVSEVQGKKIISKGKENESHIQKIYQTGHKELLESGNVSETNIESLAKQVKTFTTDILTSDYSSLIMSFRASLSNHLNKISTYRQNISGIYKDCGIEIALLIEVQSFCSSLYLYDNNHVQKDETHIIPITTDIVHELMKIDKTMVDYIILYMTSLPLSNSNNSQPYTIAIKTGNIFKHLKDQNIPVYEYIQSHPNIFSPKTDFIKRENKSYTLVFNGEFPNHITLNEYKKKFLRRIYYLDKIKQPFALDAYGHKLWQSHKHDIKSEKGIL